MYLPMVKNHVQENTILGECDFMLSNVLGTYGTLPDDQKIVFG